MSEYTDCHRAFLQTCANSGILPKMQAINILSNILRGNTFNENLDTKITENQLKDIITEINSKIKAFDQKISLCKYEYNNKEYVVFINTAESVENRLQSVYTETDLDFFRILMKEIILTDNYSINSIVALNLTSKVTVKNLTKARAETLIQEWIKFGYFYETGNQSDNLLYLGPRTLTEFKGYMKTNFANFLNSCKICKDTVFKIIKCENCDAAFHKDCITKHLAKKKSCPTCKSSWHSSNN